MPYKSEVCYKPILFNLIHYLCHPKTCSDHPADEKNILNKATLRCRVIFSSLNHYFFVLVAAVHRASEGDKTNATITSSSSIFDKTFLAAALSAAGFLSIYYHCYPVI